jgi:predicted nucleotidyltransferase component of viral defense system
VTSSAYATPTSFRQALEARLNGLASKRGVDVQRLRRQVAFDRFLCRLFQHSGEYWLLKGGYAMELRLQESRTTRDIDLTTRGPIRGSGRLADRILRLLQAAASTELGDFFVFAVGEPTQDLAGAPYGGARYPVAARLAGRVFARFHVDVGTGDPILEPVETVRGQDWLEFAGIHTTPFPIISREQQFAEKLHAYTLPRTDRPNTRVRDLLDMYLLLRAGLQSARIAEAIQAVFARRKTHFLPPTLPPPPESWAVPFASLADECGAGIHMDQAFAMVKLFLSDGKGPE